MLTIHNYGCGNPSVVIDSFDVFTDVFSSTELENLQKFFEVEGRSGVSNLRKYITNNLSVRETIAVEDEFVAWMRAHINPNISIDEALEILQNRRW